MGPRPRSAFVARPGALLCAALLLVGGCDGGLFGTGDESDASPGPDPIGAGVQGGGATAPEGEGSQPSGATNDLDEPDEHAGVFSNTLATHAGEAPLLRGVNLTRSRVRLAFDGRDAVADLPAGGVGDAVPSPLATSELVAFDAASGAPLDSRTVSLGASTLTTVLVLPDAGGAALVPLETRVRTDGPDVALVRVIDATGGTVRNSLELRPRDGGTALRVGGPAGDGIAGAYASALPGDYLVSLEGTDVPVRLDAGQTVSLVLTPAPGDDEESILVVVDSDID